MIDNNEFERRKNMRRQHRKSKNTDKTRFTDDYRDESKIKKQFKKHKQDLLEEELWQEWQDETN